MTSKSLDGGMPLGRHDDMHTSASSASSQFDRFFPVRSPGPPEHDSRAGGSASLSAHDDPRGFHDYPGAGGGGYGSAHLFSPPPPGHGSALSARDRLAAAAAGQFPFNLPPSSLPPSGFPHAMSQRPPPLGGQYPQYPRSEEEIAQAIESIAMRAAAYRPYR